MTDLTAISFGSVVENAVCEFLQKNKLRLIEKNFRCRQGEIDLMNAIKAKGEELRELIDQVQTHVDDQYIHARYCTLVCAGRQTVARMLALWYDGFRHVC